MLLSGIDHNFGFAEGPALHLSDIETSGALSIFKKSLDHLTSNFPHSKIAVVYIPSALSTYRFISTCIRPAPLELYAEKRNRVYEPAEAWQKCNLIRMQIRDILKTSRVELIDTTEQLRKEAQSTLMHGPRDPIHFNEKGYLAFSEIIYPEVMEIYQQASKSRRISLTPTQNHSNEIGQSMILGISSHYHDSAAALVANGNVLAAAQEERFTRIKHDPSFPIQAIEYCLDEAGICLENLSQIVYYEKPYLKFDRLLETYLGFAPLGLRSFVNAMPNWLREKLHLSREIKKNLPGEWNNRIVFVSHHESHAASAFFPSPFDEAAILTMDGVGEWDTATIGEEVLTESKFFDLFNFLTLLVFCTAPSLILLVSKSIRENTNSWD